MVDSQTPFDDRRATKDHTTPKRLGGNKTVLCCYKCNQIKGGVTEDEWKKFMKEHPNWIKLKTRNKKILCPTSDPSIWISKWILVVEETKQP